MVSAAFFCAHAELLFSAFLQGLSTLLLLLAIVLVAAGLVMYPGCTTQKEALGPVLLIFFGIPLSLVSSLLLWFGLTGWSNGPTLTAPQLVSLGSTAVLPGLLSIVVGMALFKLIDKKVGRTDTADRLATVPCLFWALGILLTGGGVTTVIRAWFA